MTLPPVLREVQDTRRWLDRTIALNRDRLRGAVAAARRDGYTNQEIADACGMSEAGIRKLMAKRKE